MKLKVEQKITDTEVEQLVKAMTEGKTSKGACIKALFAGGLSVKEIAEVSGIRYNHVYNVVRNEVLVHDLEVEETGRNNENSKKNQILGLLAAGKTVTEVSKELKCLYNYVWQIAKAGGYTKKAETPTEAPAAEAPKAHKSHKKEAVVA